MEKKYIDNLFKDKLEHREVAFSEEAWLAAEKMIEAEEQKRRWGGLGRLWFLLPFLIAGMLLYVYQTQTLDLPIQQNGMATMPFMIPTSGNEEPATTKELSGEDIQNDLVNTTLNENSNASPEGDASVVVAGAAITESPAEDSNKNSTKENTSVKENTIIDHEAVKTLVPPVNIPTEEILKPVKKKTAAERPMALNQELQPTATEKKETATTIIAKTNNETPTTVLQSEVLDIDYEKGTIASLDLEQAAYQIETAAPLIKDAKIRYSKRNRFSVGLLSSVILTPSFNDKIIGLSGTNIGATLSYRLNSKWSINTDFLYEFHGRNYAFPNGNNSLTYEYQTYGFGLDDNKYNVKVKQSHLVTVPLYFKYHIGRHGIDLGIQGAYTLGLRGQIEEETISANNVASTRAAKTTWVDSEKVSPFQFNLMLGYQLALSKRFSIGLRSVIVPSRLPRHGNDDEDAYNALEILGIGTNPNTVDGEKAPIPLFTHNAINFHLSVQYNLNPKVRHITKPLMGL